MKTLNPTTLGRLGNEKKTKRNVDAVTKGKYMEYGLKYYVKHRSNSVKQFQKNSYRQQLK